MPNKLLNWLTIAQEIQLGFGQILSLFAFIATVVILASPELSPQAFNSLSFQAHNCIQEYLTVFSVDTAKYLHISYGAVLG
jgi:hypothetical protein